MKLLQVVHGNWIGQVRRPPTDCTKLALVYGLWVVFVSCELAVRNRIGKRAEKGQLASIKKEFAQNQLSQTGQHTKLTEQVKQFTRGARDAQKKKKTVQRRSTLHCRSSDTMLCHFGIVGGGSVAIWAPEFAHTFPFFSLVVICFLHDPLRSKSRSLPRCNPQLLHR